MDWYRENKRQWKGYSKFGIKRSEQCERDGALAWTATPLLLPGRWENPLTNLPQISEVSRNTSFPVTHVHHNIANRLNVSTETVTVDAPIKTSIRYWAILNFHLPLPHLSINCLVRYNCTSPGNLHTTISSC